MIAALSDETVTAILVAVLGASGSAAWWFSKPHREGIETDDSAAKTITAIAAAAQILVEPLTERIEAQQLQLDSMAQHIGVLQAQVLELGASPHPAPNPVSP